MDREAVVIVSRVSPVPAPPQEVPGDRLECVLPVAYRSGGAAGPTRIAMTSLVGPLIQLIPLLIVLDHHRLRLRFARSTGRWSPPRVLGMKSGGPRRHRKTRQPV